ncbi:MAG: RagB/SusD family nutrient uptake outer membrane protein, partial [Bacteroidota bacterium]|nr:RagB/SusD family nutrient uptake outer membrane protein [Bacteroidota bacterium]
MKKITYILSCLTVLFTVISCQDFLEEENESFAVAEEFYLTGEGYQSLINANYSQLRELYGNAPWIYVCGTDLFAEGRDAEPTGLSRYSDL